MTTKEYDSIMAGRWKRSREAGGLERATEQSGDAHLEQLGGEPGSGSSALRTPLCRGGSCGAESRAG